MELLQWDISIRRVIAGVLIGMVIVVMAYAPHILGCVA